MQQNSESTIKKFFDTYFTFNGRLNRKPFIMRILASILITIILFLTIILVFYGDLTLENVDEYNLSIPYFIILFVNTWFFYANANRRFQDMNKDKKWTIFAFLIYLPSLFLDFTKQYPELSFVISCISFAIFIYLCVKKGTFGPNKYGDTQNQEELK